jgi:DNA-binding transcriptional LysR family regulator
MDQQFNFPLDIVRSVVTIADAGSLSKACIRLSLSQPALGSHIERMQSILGFKIFTNEPNGTVPTETGLLFLHQARRILESDHEIPRIGGHNRSQQPLRFGIMNLYVPELFECLSIESLLNVMVQGGTSTEIAGGLRDGNIDIGCFFASGPTIDQVSNLIVNETEEEFVWLSSTTFVYKPSTPVPLITHPDNTSDSFMIQTLLREGIPYRIAFTSADSRARSKAAQQGFGITAFPSRYEHSPLRAEKSFLPELPPLKVLLCARQDFHDGSDLMKAVSAIFFKRSFRPMPADDH